MDNRKLTRQQGAAPTLRRHNVFELRKFGAENPFEKVQKSQFRVLELTPPTTTPEKIYKMLTRIRICIVC
jgi:hypothetical protein